MKFPLVILGAGGHGHVIADAAMMMGLWDGCIFYDDVQVSDNPNIHWPVAGSFEDFFSQTRQPGPCIIGLGDNRLRQKLHDRAIRTGWTLASVIHSSAVVSQSASIGSGSVVMAGAIVNARSSVGSCCVINTNSSVDHDCIIGDGCHIGPGVNLGGNVTMRKSSWIAIGATVISNINIGASAVVGAGSTVINDIEADTIMVGSPATRRLSKLPSYDL